MKYICLFIFSFYSILSFAQEDSVVGRDLINKERFSYIKSNNDGATATFSEVDGEEILNLKTIVQPKFIYKHTTTLPINAERIKENTALLLSFDAITQESSEETGEAKLMVQVRQTDSFKENLDRTLNIGSVWKRYYIPFLTTQNISKNDLGIVLQYGFQPQEILLKNIKFEVFDETVTIDQLPKTKVTYIGMEPDAQWRKDANARIEQFRKSDFEINILKDGKPVPNANLKIELKRHSFPFGATMHASEILNNENQYQKFKNAFGLTVLGNDLKIKRWSRKENRAITLAAIDKLRRDNISVKGHVLIWPGFQYNPGIVKKNAKNPEKLEKIIKSHIYSVLDATEGKITHWDVTNETYTNRDFQNLFGNEELLYDGFRILRNRQPNVYRFTNEYGIISKGGIDSKKQLWYYDYIKRVDENTHNAVQGIGIQSHMGTDLTPPERVLEILAFYATLGKQISISEFTMDEQDPVVREQYTRDFMIAAFSHPNVAEFMFWGFQEDGRGKVDIYEADGTIGEMGKAYFSLVNGAWKTNISEATNSKGQLINRGFNGLYEFSVTVDGETKKGYFDIQPNSDNKINIEL